MGTAAVADTEPKDVWRTADRLHTDDATIARLCGLAATDPSITDVIGDLQAAPPGNGSVWASGTARVDGTAALLKLGARPEEREWLTAMAASSLDIVPRVFGAGEMRGVGWLVLERCDVKLDQTSFEDALAIIDTVARYQQVGAVLSAVAPGMDLDWVRKNLLDARDKSCPGEMDRALAEAARSWDFVTSQCAVTPNHGDVHFANVVVRSTGGPALHIDTMPITTVWPYDAAYFEVVHGHPGMIRELARRRGTLGLPTAEELERVERIVLGCAAALWWRIAPWRHGAPAQRSYVEARVDELRW